VSNTTDLIHRLRERARIRRQIPDRKSVQEGQPDRIADLLDEAATALAGGAIPGLEREIAALKHQLFVETKSAEQLGRLVNAKDAERIYFRDDARQARIDAAAEAKRLTDDKTKLWQRTIELESECAALKARAGGDTTPRTHVQVPIELVMFLLGEAALEGVWFGDKPANRGALPGARWWWRTQLRALVEGKL